MTEADKSSSKGREGSAKKFLPEMLSLNAAKLHIMNRAMFPADDQPMEGTPNSRYGDVHGSLHGSDAGTPQFGRREVLSAQKSAQKSVQQYQASPLGRNGAKPAETDTPTFATTPLRPRIHSEQFFTPRRDQNSPLFSNFPTPARQIIHRSQPRRMRGQPAPDTRRFSPACDRYYFCLSCWRGRCWVWWFCCAVAAAKPTTQCIVYRKKKHTHTLHISPPLLKF